MGVFRRGDRWYVRWRRDGRLIRKTLGPDIRTKAQAEAAWRKIRQQVADDKLTRLDPSRVTLEWFRETYLAARRPLNYSPATLRRDDQALRSLAEVLGDCLLRNINQRKIDQWAGVLLGRGVSPRTINSYLRHLKAALSRAVEWGYLPFNPLSSVKLMKEDNEKMWVLSEKEEKRLLAQCAKRPQ